MLSIGKLSGGANTERYYTQSVANGREDYYAGKGEAPGHWAGTGSDIETDQGVSEDELRNLLQGKHPTTGVELRPMTDRSVAGFDLTFRAPKSVSILFAVGDQQIVAAACGAHDAATEQALGYLERSACKTRRRRDGQIRSFDGAGFVAATFRHRTSRAGDPLLHTHVVVGNLTQGPDGTWSALDGRQLYRHAKTAGYLYQAALRAELSERLDVTWTPVVNGTAEVVGIARPVIDHFSRRRQEIVEHMQSRGERSARAAQIATLQTRKRKDYDVPVDRLREQWRARAAEHGLTAAALRDVLQREAPEAPGSATLARRAADMAGPHGVTRDASTFDRRDVLRGWAERHREGARATELEQLADAWLDSSAVTRLRPKRPTPEPLFTTPEMLDTERQLLAAADRGRDQRLGTADHEDVDAALVQRPSIDAEQAEMVRQLTTSGHGIEVVRAAAGTGKTFALDAARQAWEHSGRTVIGCALSARAAGELAEQTAMPTTTIAQLQIDLDHGRGLAPDSVLVVDEAGMVGTRALAQLAAHAEHARVKLVLVGDDRQLPEIQAGGAFRALAEETGAITLTEVRRQAHAWDRDALDHLRHGRTEQWLDAYADHGRIRGAHDADQTRALLVDDWHKASREQPGADALMIAHRRSDVTDLNERARQRLRDAGNLGDDEVDVGGRGFATGDRVVTTHNDRRLGLANGTRARITEIDSGSGVTKVEVDDGREVTLPATYLQDGHLDHGYATTAHRAQGATVDHAFVLGSDDLYREWGYTALTRHRDTATFYVNLGDGQTMLPGFDEDDVLASDPGEIRATLGRSQAKAMAADRGAPAHDRASRETAEPAVALAPSGLDLGP